MSSNGGDTITTVGLCCSKVSGFNPETESEITTRQTGSGSFTSTLTGLQPGTTYYVRAYVETEVA